ncbi:MAG: ATP-binding protein [Sulfurimicrobium sp.]|nr:ATP-binding protein [Sulfurimicrobium sp.]
MNTFISLRQRLLWPLMALMLFTGGVGSAVVYWYSHQELEQELELRGHLLSGAVVFAADASVSRDELDRFVLAMSAEKDVESVFVVTADLKQVVAGNPYLWNDKLRSALFPLAQRALDTHMPQGGPSRDAGDQYLVAAPLLLSDIQGKNALHTAHGLVLVQLNTEMAHRTAFETALAQVAALLAVCASALILTYWLLHWRIINPSRRIVNAILLWKAGGVARTDLQPIDELGVIGEALDDLVDTLRVREQTLMQQQHFLKTVTDAVPGMLGYWNDELRCGFANNAYQEWFGRRADEVIGMHLAELLGEEIFHQNEAHIRAALSGEPQHFERCLIKADGSTGYILTQYIPDVRNGRTQGFLVLATDITELKKTQFELEKINAELKERTIDAEAANQAKSTFVSNMSHELRTPLHAILGFSDILRRDAGLTSAQKEVLATIQKSGEHLLSLINDVLDIAKIEAGRVELVLAPFDFGGMLSDVTEMLRIRAQEKGLQLRVDQSAVFPPYIVGDQAKLRQILINLISNAIKATEQGGVTLRLGLADESGHFFIDVEDTGAGIAPGDQSRIFEAFVQVTGASDKQQGTGLGLSITRQFVDLMGGSLSLSSQVGKGSTFRVDIPVQLAQPEEVPDVPPARGEVASLKPGHPSCRILVAEDQRESQLLLGRLLESVGFEVRLAENGAEAVEQFQNWRPQFVWMDLRMPEMDGVEATRRIRALPGGEAVKIAAVTASIFRGDEDELMAAGFDTIMHKPFRSGEIFGCMERLLDLRFDRVPAERKEQCMPDLSTAAFAAMPEALRKNLEDAMVILDGERIMKAIDDISKIYPELGSAIKFRAQSYNYESILALLHSSPAAAGEAEAGAEGGKYG